MSGKRTVWIDLSEVSEYLLSSGGFTVKLVQHVEMVRTLTFDHHVLLKKACLLGQKTSRNLKAEVMISLGHSLQEEVHFEYALSLLTGKPEAPYLSLFTL